MAIRQTISFNTNASNLYKVLTSSAEFSQFTNAPAEIDASEGGAFSCFGGQITGRQVELTPNQRIVQAWRAGPWDDGVYSIVRFDISEADGNATLVLEHAGFPEGGEEHLEGGWHKMYWEPLRAYFA